MGVPRMIKLPDGELRDYLPPAMKNDVDMACLSYAIKKAAGRLARYREAAMVYHFTGSVPEPILDLLAVELRSLYYSDALPVETKRSIVRNTLRWHAQAGTPGAVAEMVEAVFGEGGVIEWPDFEGPPYTPGTFDIVTGAQLTPDILGYLASIIGRVKNARSHLRRIVVKRACQLQVHAGVGGQALVKPAAVVDGHQGAYQAVQAPYAGTAGYAVYYPQAIIDGAGGGQGQALGPRYSIGSQQQGLKDRRG